ncbi:MAG: DUF1361 domain-containing protein [Dokdonia sp.]|nr:DUF1361 domain-containing protein [Dokdonia sp.]
MKTLLFSKFRELSILLAGFVLCFFLLAVRIKTWDSFFFLFLAWNIFLAFIPYGITMGLQSREILQKKKWLLIPFTVGWILFLPNTPYLISDLQHLRHSAAETMWYDVIMLTSFAWYALFIMYLTVRDMLAIWERYLPSGSMILLTIGVFILCGFGIYLGRFLRWNSWDIIQDPMTLIYDILIRVRHPFQYSQTWLVTFGYGAFTSLFYFGMRATAHQKL